jgi:hypothetical protein
MKEFFREVSVAHYYSVYHLLADVMQRKKLIDLACVLDLENYVLSLDRWLQMPIHVKTKDERQDCFDKYLPIVKPMVHRFHTRIPPTTQSPPPSTKDSTASTPTPSGPHRSRFSSTPMVEEISFRNTQKVRDLRKGRLQRVGDGGEVLLSRRGRNHR